MYYYFVSIKDLKGLKNMTEEEKKTCPFCGAPISSNEVMCNQCRAALPKEEVDKLEQSFIKSTNNENKGKNNNTTIGVIIIALLIAIIGNNIKNEENNSPTTNPSENNTVVESTVNYNEHQRVTGDFSGFGKWASFKSNYGGQMANCQHKGVGISLTEQIEYFFENVSEKKRPEFYSIKQQNPNLRFHVTKPVWAENATFLDACKADVQFENISEDTVMGYSGGRPFYPDNAYCRITYTVSQQGDKYRANVINMFCTPTDGYR